MSPSKTTILLLALLAGAVVYNGNGITSSFVRKNENSGDMPLDSDVFQVSPGYNAPQQVHITQGDHKGKAVIVSWVTVEEPVVTSTRQRVASPRKITIIILLYDTNYYYKVGTWEAARTFWFTTPPEVGLDVPYTFGLIETVLYVGDLSYADNHPNHDNVRWDTWGRFVERSVVYQPWIWTAGNHELDFAPEISETTPFKPFTHRYRTPYEASNNTTPFWYSIKRASAYIIVLSSYSAYGKYTPQYRWLEEELPKVNRSETPWLIVMTHSPWYNNYKYHYMEGESMRVMFESWFVKYKVDVVFSGHVHAYERSERVSNDAYTIVNGLCSPKKDQFAPVYITIGDGGNIEGLGNNMTEPQPKYSAFREASFGHATFNIKNSTHAYYSWHRNQDVYAIEADSLWFFNKFWHPIDDSTTSA
ncbi:hypothetical protein ACS0TY_003850 [Phlomoides rotata]